MTASVGKNHAARVRVRHGLSPSAVCSRTSRSARLIEADDAKQMAQYQPGGGFSVDAGVCIAATDRAGLERLLRDCARPPLSIERLRQKGSI